MNRRNITLALVLSSLLLGLLTACNSNPGKNADSLRSNARAYGKLIRWKAYEDASQYIKLRDESDVKVDMDFLEEIRVTKYEVGSMVLNETKDEAVVTVEISYYHERANNVHNIREEQIWWQDEDSKAWYLDGQLPPFKR